MVVLACRKGLRMVRLNGTVLTPNDVTLEDGFARDVRGVGHHGTGGLDLTIRNWDDLEKAKPLIQRSFDEN